MLELEGGWRGIRVCLMAGGKWCYQTFRKCSLPTIGETSLLNSLSCKGNEIVASRMGLTSMERAELCPSMARERVTKRTL